MIIAVHRSIVVLHWATTDAGGWIRQIFLVDLILLEFLFDPTA